MSKENEFVLSDDAIAEQTKNALGDAQGSEDLRSQVIEALGVADDDEYKFIIDRAVEREQKLRAGYGELLGKKYIPLKKAYQEMINDPRFKQDNTASLSSDEWRKQQEQIVAERFNEEFLEDLEYSDDIKKEIREWTKYKGVSAKAAVKAPHISTLISEFEKTQRNAKALNNGTGNGGAERLDGGSMPDKFLDPKYMATEKGKKDFDDWSKSKDK